MKETVTTLMVLSLVGNILPGFNIFAILSLILLFLLHRDSREAVDLKYGPEAARKILLSAYIYWIFSYLITEAPISNLFSFEFLRFDGALLIAYLPLLFVTDLRLSPGTVRRVLNVFLTSMSAVALLGLAEFVDITLTPLGLSWLPEPLQVIHNSALTKSIFHGFFRAHNAAGAVYAMAALLAFSLVANGERPALVSWPSVWLAANVIGLALTQSRTCYLAFCGTSLLMFFKRKASLKNALKYACPILLPVLCFLLLQPAVSHRTEEVSDLEDPNIVMRFLYYQRALEDFSESPIVGIGFGRYNDELKIYSGVPHVLYFATGGSVANDDKHAHNSYLHFLAEGGIVGLSLMLGVWIAIFRWVGKQTDIFACGTFGYCFAEGIRACILLEFFVSLTEHMMGTAVSSLTIFTMVVLLLNLVGWKHRIASLVDKESSWRGGQHAWSTV